MTDKKPVPCAEVPFTTYGEAVRQALDTAGAREVMARQKLVLVKPNLVNAAPPPVTTPVDCCAAVIDYVREFSRAEVVIGEGCGDALRDTAEVFELLGYADLASRTGAALVDLNTQPLRRLTRPDCPVFPEMHLPEISLEAFLLSVPVLKAHSLAGMTGSLKNMIGLAPPRHYAGSHGTWKKAVFHSRMQQSIIDLNRYRCADLTVMDASVGMAEYHLGGPECDPPINRILAGFDPLALDREGAGLLGLDWRDVGHLAVREPFRRHFE